VAEAMYWIILITGSDYALAQIMFDHRLYIGSDSW